VNKYNNNGKKEVALMKGRNVGGCFCNFWIKMGIY
jgi:hypothetical protein